VIIDLRARLLAMQDNLRDSQRENYEITAKYLDCKRDLKRERKLNEIAFKYIPEDRHLEYESDCPNGQQVSVDSSPAASVCHFALVRSLGVTINIQPKKS
jgi:hypothetical protein